jgi:diadenylate cyclase
LTVFDWVIPIRVVDLIEIGLVAWILYMLYQWMRGTIAVQIFVGILALYLIQVLVTAANMTMLRALFGAISNVFVLAVIILFQPEIRRLLLRVGQNPLVRRLMASPAQEGRISTIVEAISEMSDRKIGALIAFERNAGLRGYIETGAQLHAFITRDLLLTIFYAQNPLHDGAVIVRNGRIEAARCILPVSASMNIGSDLGLRHRAAIGLTEETDAIVVVVSEETGRVSVSQEGKLESGVSTGRLRQMLFDALSPQLATPEEPADA